MDEKQSLLLLSNCKELIRSGEGGGEGCGALLPPHFFAR